VFLLPCWEVFATAWEGTINNSLPAAYPYQGMCAHVTLRACVFSYMTTALLLLAVLYLLLASHSKSQLILSICYFTVSEVAPLTSLKDSFHHVKHRMDLQLITWCIPNHSVNHGLQKAGKLHKTLSIYAEFLHSKDSLSVTQHIPKPTLSHTDAVKSLRCWFLMQEFPIYSCLMHRKLLYCCIGLVILMVTGCADSKHRGNNHFTAVT